MSVKNINVTKNVPAITVIGFRRPDHMYTTLHALSQNHGVQKSHLHIFLDGARSDVEGEKEQVKQTHKVCKDFLWTGKKVIHVSKINRGLQHAVRFAIDTTFNDYKSAIIIEDDIVTSPYFYQFVTDGLSMFEKTTNVAAICGHCYPFSRKKYNPTQVYFLRHFACWGWATWRRTWEGVIWDTKELMTKLKKSKARHILDFGNSHWVSGILEAHHNGYINTWDAQTAVSLFLNKQLCLYPRETLTNNIGWRRDGLSTHVEEDININAALAYIPMYIDKNIKIKESVIMRKVYQQFICPFHEKIIGYIKTFPRFCVNKIWFLQLLNEFRKKQQKKRRNKKRIINVLCYF